MLTILIGKHLDDARRVLEKFGLTEAAPGETPELVVAHGGDGTLLEAERLYPGLPKLTLRDAGTAPLCPEHACEKQVANYLAGGAGVTHLPKLGGFTAGGKLFGINDVFIHNSQRVNALRYKVWIDGELYANEIVGDGAGVSTIHGSTAYYRSITHSLFRVGLGLAFSNCTEAVDHLVVPESSRITLEIVRGPGLMVADNSPEAIALNEGDRVEIYLTGDSAEVHNLKAFMCPACRLLRHPNRFKESLLSMLAEEKESAK